MQKSTDKTVIESNTEPDYSAVSPPAKPPTEYTYVERRAELLELVEQAGHPAALNQSELAERYGCSQPQISKDLNRLDGYVRERLARRRDLQVGSVLKRCMTGALEEGDYNVARKAAKDYDEYIDGRIDTLELRRRIEALENAAKQGVNR